MLSEEGGKVQLSNAETHSEIRLKIDLILELLVEIVFGEQNDNWSLNSLVGYLSCPPNNSSFSDST